MSSLTIRHVTTYRYKKPVGFGEHRMMLRPRDGDDQKVVAASLGITPPPSSLQFTQDAFGNHVAIARFAERATELSFESIVKVDLNVDASVDHSPPAAAALEGEAKARTFPVEYSADDLPALEGCLARHHPAPASEVDAWARQFLSPDGSQEGAPDRSIDALALFTRLSRGINRQFRYRRREAKGIQSPLETLRQGHGSCRDFALLMIEAARTLGFAARFVSGYLATAYDAPAEPHAPADVSSPHGATHAWAQVFLPESGWVDFDPTCGSVGKAALVTVAVVPDPDHALPLHGTFIGAASDLLGMEVRVSVTAGGA